MSKNAYGTKRADLLEESEDMPDGNADAGHSAKKDKPSLYKAQMLRSNILLVALFAIGVAVVYVLYLHEGPAEVKASARQQAVESQVDSAILRFSQEAAAGAKAPTAGQITRRVLENFHHQITDRQIPLSRLKKNPFVFGSPTSTASSAVGKSRKPGPAPAKTTEKDTYERAAVAFSSLHLQSVMMGRNGGTALISNNLLTVGQEIEGFTIESINSRSVVLVWQDKKYVLEMP